MKQMAAIIFLVTVLLSMTACGKSDAKKSVEQVSKPPVAVEVRVAAASSLSDGIEVTGGLEPKFSADVKTQIVSTADDQREGLADQIGGVADALKHSGEQLKGNQEWIARLVDRGAGELGTLAETLRTNDLQGLMGKLQDLAKRQPAIFVGAAMAAGFATVRLGKVAVAGATKADLPTMPEIARESD